MEAKIKSPKVLTLIALSVVINIIGSFLALSFRLPVYLDTIGTIFSGVAFGPVIALIVGALSALISGLLFDPTSLYYLPVQLVIGFLTGLFFKNHRFEGFKSIIYILIITLAGAIISSLITTFVFSGITSSGSSYIVQLIHAAGINLISSVFSTQILSDILDKGISFFIVFTILKVIPKRYLNLN